MILKALFYYLFHRNKNRQADTTPSPDIDLSRYLGRWYELARFDTPFENGLEEVFTDYKALSNGKVCVSNNGLDTHNHRHSAKAIGTPSGPGQMQVSFIPWLRFLSTPYNILYVDDFYTNALVSNESGSCLWFLSRKANIEVEAFEMMIREAQSRGFNLSDLHYTRHRYQA